MTELGGQTARITMGEVRLDAGKTRRFTTSVQSIGGFDRLLWPSARFAVAQDARRRDPGPITTGNPGNVGLDVDRSAMRVENRQTVDLNQCARTTCVYHSSSRHTVDLKSTRADDVRLPYDPLPSFGRTP